MSKSKKFESQMLEDWVEHTWHKHRRFPTVKEAALRFSVSQKRIRKAAKDCYRGHNAHKYPGSCSGLVLYEYGRPDDWMKYDDGSFDDRGGHPSEYIRELPPSGGGIGGANPCG